MTNISNINSIIIENNHYATIKLESGLFKILDKHLSWKDENFDYQMARNSKGWDGVNHLLSKNGKFSIGLLTKVLDFCHEQDIEISVIDNRKPKVKNAPIDILPALTKQGRIPRDYQVNTVKAAIESSGRGICRLATSAGKSIIISMLTAEINTPTCIFVIGLDLLNQFHKDMSSLFDEEIGYVGNGVVNIKRINIVSIWTAGSALNINKKDLTLEDGQIAELPTSQSDKIKINKMLKDSQLHIIDECHVSSCSTIQSIYKAINPVYLFGFSGTPLKGVSQDLLTTSILGEELINVSASSLIKRNVIARPVIKYINVPNMGNQGETYQEVYKNYIVENDMRNSLVVSETKKLLDKKYTVLVLFKSIKHGEILREKFLKSGIAHEFLSGKDDLDKRDIVKENVMNGKSNLIVCSSIFEIGVSIERLSAIVLASGGKSYVRCLQRVGRVVRGYTSPEGIKKTTAAVVEFYDNCKYLKKHSLKRYEIYCTEPEFKIITCEAMKKYI